jgi:hypothetical protein
MKTLLAAATIVALSTLLNVSPASAAQYGPPAVTSGTPHWEWQYHYVGRHPRYEGHWVLVN